MLRIPWMRYRTAPITRLRTYTACMRVLCRFRSIIRISHCGYLKMTWLYLSLYYSPWYEQIRLDLSADVHDIFPICEKSYARWRTNLWIDQEFLCVVDQIFDYIQLNRRLCTQIIISHFSDANTYIHIRTCTYKNCTIGTQCTYSLHILYLFCSYTFFL